MHRPIPYRPEIDGLRAFAVISVLIYHLNKNWLPGGYLGVDVFFVISGFLITSIIVKQCADSRFRFSDFYLRRAHRILPAMLVVTVLTCIASYYILYPDDLRASAKGCRRALLCSANYLFAKQNGYFHAAAEKNPFLHTWSLGVEEQFYFIFPLLAWFAIRRDWLKAKWLGVFVLLGFTVSCVLTVTHPTRAFFVLESRAWELAAGAWLAVAMARNTMPVWLTKRSVAYLSFLLLLGSVVFAQHGALVPAPLAATAVLGAVLFISSRAGSSDDLGHRLFASFPLRFMGKISYVLYLVHWPIIVLSHAWFGEFSSIHIVGVVSASVVLAILLHVGVEQPLRVIRKPAVFLTTVLLVTIGLIWYVGDVKDKKGAVNPAMCAALNGILPEWSEPENKRVSPYLIGKMDVKPSIALWGDSHAMAMIPTLSAELSRRGLCCEVWARPGNLVAIGVERKREDQPPINEKALEAMVRPEIHFVIISCRWTAYMKGAPEVNELSPVVAGAANAEEAFKLMRVGMERAISQLNHANKKIVLVYPVPEAVIHVPYHLARKVLAGQSIHQIGLAAPAKDYSARHDLTNALLDEMSNRFGLIAVHPEQHLIKNGTLCISQNSMSLYVDDDHLSSLGCAPIVQEILSHLPSSVPPN